MNPVKLTIGERAFLSAGSWGFVLVELAGMQAGLLQALGRPNYFINLENSSVTVKRKNAGYG
jgi:hypothetical protein